MNATLLAVRNGFARGWAELRHTFTTAEDLWQYFFPAILLTVVMVFMRNAHVPGTTFSLGTRTLPSALGMGIAFGGLLTLSQQLITDRSDGTLLRAKAIPHGMLGYLVGKITTTAAVAILSISLQLIPGLFVLHGFELNSASRWLTLAWVVLLGLIATVPIGAIIGSLFDDPRNMGLVVLPLFALIATSGIFYPITNFPTWLQWVAQVFPIYWLGLGMRSAMLPANMAAVEFGGSWRHLETVAVLGTWAVLGLLVAPIVLRRMARRESGSRLEVRRQKAMQRAV